MHILKLAYGAVVTAAILAASLTATAGPILTPAQLQPLLLSATALHAPGCELCSAAMLPMEPAFYWTLLTVALGIIGSAASASSASSTIQARRKPSRHLILCKQEAKRG